MLQRGQALAQAGLVGGIDVGDDNARATRQAIEYDAPGIDDHAVAMRLAAREVVAALRRRDDVSQIFDRARADQRLEMRAAGGGGEGRGHDDDVHVRHRAVQLGETQVVADRQPDAAERAVDDDDGVARLDEAGFLVALVAEVQAEQMDLVVACHLLAALVVDEATVAHLAGGARLQRHRAADQPDLVLFRHARQEGLDRPAALGLARLDHVGVLHRHDGEEFGQRDQPRAAADREFDQPLGLGEVGRHVGAGGHLDRGDPHGARLRGRLLDLRAFGPRDGGSGDFLRHHLAIPGSGFGGLRILLGWGLGQAFHVGRQPGAAHQVFLADGFFHRVAQEFLRGQGAHARDRPAEERARHGHAFGQLGRHLDPQLHAFAFEIGQTRHAHLGGRAAHPEVVAVHHAARDAQGGADIVEGIA